MAGRGVVRLAASFLPAGLFLSGLEALTRTPHINFDPGTEFHRQNIRPFDRYPVVAARREGEAGMTMMQGAVAAARRHSDDPVIKSWNRPLFANHHHGHNLSIDMSKLSPNQQHWVKEHQRLHEKHRGHEVMHIEMLLVLLATLIFAQISLVQWKKRHFRSYERATLIGMCFIPFGFSVYFHWLRFIVCWTFFSIVTGFVTLMATRKPLAGGTPRLVYKWFLFIYKLSYTLGMIGYFIITFTMFNVNMIFFIKFHVAMNFGLVLLFYGLYFGVVTRDFAEVCSDTMASQVGFYTSSGLPSRQLNRHVCAVCGHPTSTNYSSSSSPQKGSYWYSPPLDTDESESDSADESNKTSTSSVPGERTYKLNCGHLFHEYCIRGWCIVGKKQTCPYCKEKVDLKRMFPGPWERPHVLYGNLLDWIRYLLVWQPVIIILVETITWVLGLK